MMILQVPVADAAVAEEATMSLLDLAMKGGIMMIPILLMSIVTLYIFVDRLMTLRSASTTPANFKDDIRNKVLQGDVAGAKMICEKTSTPIAKMIGKGLSRIGNPLKSIEASIENVGKIEVYRLEKNLNILATIAGAAPMIGFLGTVTGMIQAFISIAKEEGAVSPKLLSNGIYEAMITTAAGLVVGILAYLAYNFLISRMSKVIHNMEYNSIEFIDLLQEPQSHGA